MTRDFILPDLGEGVHEGQIMSIMVAEGQSVREDEPLIEVETDKARVEIPSPYTGTVARVHVSEQQLVHVGDVMFSFSDGSEATDVAPQSTTAPAPAAPIKTPITPSPQTSQQRRIVAAPSVRRMARQRGIDLTNVQGSGPGGRIHLCDLDSNDVVPPAAAEISSPVRVSPLPVPPSSVAGSPSPPPQVINAANLPTSPALSLSEIPGGRPDQDQYGMVIRQPLSQARHTIARIMSQSWATIPHVTDTDDADVTDLESLRKAHKNTSHPERKITMLCFLVRAVTRALERFPIFNASVDENTSEIVYRQYINVAIGVETERGLVAPVIHNTNQLSILHIADALDVISANARSASFAVNDTRGGTYTISNAGAIGGSRYSTPIITPPQVAVLAAGRMRLMPWVVDGEIKPRLIMPLSHSIDHRIIDGGKEIPFLQFVIAQLQNPLEFVLSS
ncbi:MAG: dihydrolipoamide acetyltransferase family protein [Phycisphaerales bacterium]|nr:dihydrolipoamide acetyltransferase family protein [Phycisphaerales bacterium]